MVRERGLPDTDCIASVEAVAAGLRENMTTAPEWAGERTVGKSPLLAVGYGKAAGPAAPAAVAPIDMILQCPACGAAHVDAPGEGWTNPPHRSHLCGGCGTIWRPADVPTNGVAHVRTRGSADNWTGPAAGEDADPPSRMVKINTMIADLQKISERFGNTCVYVRRGGLSWGAAALNRRSDDEEHGVFDLQAQHDRDLEQCAGQVERLITDCNRWRDAQWKSEKTIAELQARMSAACKALTTADEVTSAE